MSDGMPKWAPCAVATATSIALAFALVMAQPGKTVPVQVPAHALTMAWIPSSALGSDEPSHPSAATLARAD